MGCLLFDYYKYRRNQMSLQYSECELGSLALQLDAFLCRYPQPSSPAAPAPANGNCRPETEALSELEARQVLLRLVEREQAGGQRKNWKAEETSYMLFLVGRYCQAQQLPCDQLTVMDWERISSLVPARTASACLFRFLSLRPAPISSAPWSAHEGQLLQRIVEKHEGSAINWRSVSQQLYEAGQQAEGERRFRTGKQCREHYACFLKPDLRKGAWTEEEDYLLVSLFLRVGRRWSRIAQLIHGRNENAIKNRFFLMFENRKDARLTSPDLLKMVRRRKLKLEQRIVPEEKPSQEHTLSPSSEAPSLVSIHSMEQGEWTGREQFERYIDL